MMSPDQEDWLSLAAASKRLGVHPNTLRRWVDAGSVPSLRTPGGHRRFRAADLAAWVKGQQSTALTTQAEGGLTSIVSFARHEMTERHVSSEAWYRAFDQEADRQKMRETGQRLFGLAIQYAGRTSNHEIVLQEGQRIGEFYGQQCAQHNIPLVDTVRGFFFFRESLLRATWPDLGIAGQHDEEGARIHQQLRYFLDQVMYACLASYEVCCLRALHAGDSA